MKIKVNEDLSLTCLMRDKKKKKKDKRIIRLGKAYIINKYKYEFNMTKTYKKIFKTFLNSEKIKFSIDRELISSKAMISSLISSKISKQVHINTKNVKYFNTNWKIS